MRLTELRKSAANMLLEHNVVNRDKISEYVEQFAAEAVHPNAKEWFRKVLARYLEKDDTVNQPVTPETMPKAPPAWLAQAIERGDDLRIFHPSEDMMPTFHHLVDFFNYLPENEEGSRIIENPQRVMAITVPVAIKKSNEWTEHLAKKAEKQAVVGFEGVQVLYKDGNYTWVKALTTEVLQRDGAILRNCLASGNHHADAMAGRELIPILRDQNGHPHVAICMKRRGDGWQVDEVKGKQNSAPVGRYAQYTVRFLNSLTNISYTGTGSADISRMGLMIDPQTNKVGTISDFHEVIFRSGDVSVVKMPSTTRGAVDFWFSVPGEQNIARLNVAANNTVTLEGFSVLHKNVLLPVMKEFLNTQFSVPPAPRSLDNGSNFTKVTGLSYNYNTPKYGNSETDSDQEAEEGGMKIMSWGSTPSSVDYFVWNNGKVVLRFRATNNRIGAVLDADGRRLTTSDKVEPEDITFACKFLNKLGMEPTGGFESGGSEVITYNQGKGFGPLEQVGTPVWKGGGVTVYQWRMSDIPTRKSSWGTRDEPSDNIRFTFRKGGKTLATLSLVDGNKLINIIEDKKAIPSVIAALNQSPVFKAMDWSVVAPDLGDIGIYQKDGKFGEIGSVAEVVKTFPDGWSARTAQHGPGTIYAFFDGDKPVYGVELNKSNIEGDYGIVNGVFTGSGEPTKLPASLGRKIQAVFNEVGTKEADTAAATSGVRAVLFSLGLYWDTRTSSWKMLQDGKIVHQDKGWKAVTFRNRVVIVKEADEVIGWFKKSGEEITDETASGGHSKEQLLSYLDKLTKQTPFKLGGDDGYGYRYRRHGYFQDRQGTVSKITDVYPDKVLKTFPNGSTWHRRAYSPSHSQEEGVNGERYTLEGKDGKPIFRLEFGADGYLYEISHTRKVDHPYRGVESQSSTSLKYITDSDRVALVALLELLGKKLTATQSLDAGLYRAGDKYKLLKSNKSLRGYLEGEIDFKDGHVFTREQYGEKEWKLSKSGEEDKYGSPRAYMQVKLDDDGISSIKFLDKSVKRRPHEYTPYLHKLMDLFAMVSGEKTEDE